MTEKVDSDFADTLKLVISGFRENKSMRVVMKPNKFEEWVRAILSGQDVLKDSGVNFIEEEVPEGMRPVINKVGLLTARGGNLTDSQEPTLKIEVSEVEGKMVSRSSGRDSDILFGGFKLNKLSLVLKNSSDGKGIEIESVETDPERIVMFKISEIVKKQLGGKALMEKFYGFLSPQLKANGVDLKPLEEGGLKGRLKLEE